MLNAILSNQHQREYPFNSTNSVIENVSEDEFSAHFDYAAIFKLDGQGNPNKLCRRFVKELQDGGMQLFFYKSVQQDELIVLLRAPLEKLKRFADHSNFKMKADPTYVKKVVEQGDAANKIRGVVINENPEISTILPYDYCFLEFEEEKNINIYGGDDAFDKTVRLKLTYSILRGPKLIGGFDFEIERYIHDGKMLALFPIHDRKTAKQISEYCQRFTVFPWHAPVEDIRRYFGEKIALFNVFLGHYSLWLLWPSVIGIVFQLVVWSTLNFSHPVLPFFSLFISLWSILMLEYWKREESYMTLKWGMSDFESKELDRPQFEGDIVPSHINGRLIAYYPKNKASTLVKASGLVVLSFLCVVVGAVAGIYILRFYLQNQDSTSSSASTIASIINTIQITIFNIIYQKLAIKLTDLENHRTDTEYDDSLIVKLFVFQFINSFASFFFLAFIAGNLDRPKNAPSDHLGQCGSENCMQPLSVNLAIIFGTRLTLTNFLDVFLPFYSHQSKIKQEKEGIEKGVKLTPVEKDYVLMPFDNHLETIRNYADTVIQYAFTVLFITALPCATFFSLLSNYVKVKVNAWKMVKLYQRPVPLGVQDIGTWQTIFKLISNAAVVTNGALICFTMNVLWSYSLEGRVWIFLGFQWVLMSVQYIFEVAIPDVPEEVQIQKERIQFIEDKVIRKVEDDDYNLTSKQLNKQKSMNMINSQRSVFSTFCESFCDCCTKKDADRLGHGDDDDVLPNNAAITYDTYPAVQPKEEVSMGNISIDVGDTNGNNAYGSYDMSSMIGSRSAE